ncbi:MAG: hypothetical protein ACI3XJ_00700 [Oscillospiraceae bacterium]
MGIWRSSGGKENNTSFDPASEQQKAVEAAKRSRKLNSICLVVIIVVFLAYSLFFQKPKVEATMGDNAFGLITLNDTTIAFYLTDVESVELGDSLSTFDKGTFQSGTEESTCCSGTYVNDAFGEYELHVNLKVEPYVIVHYTDGILVFNNPSAEGTMELYTNLLDAVGN